MNSISNMEETLDRMLLLPDGQYVCIESFRAEKENMIILVAQEIYYDACLQFQMGKKIFTKVDPMVVHRTGGDLSRFLPTAIWHPLKMLNKSSDPLFKTLYE